MNTNVVDSGRRAQLVALLNLALVRIAWDYAEQNARLAGARASQRPRIDVLIWDSILTHNGIPSRGGVSGD
jgi:hypothetical protein